MKSVLISIKPKWCELIASGKKTIEIRKTRPKIETPFKVYIYCTQARNPIRDSGRILMYEDDLALTNRWGQGKFVENPCGAMMEGEFFLNGKVIGEFVCDEILQFNQDDYNSPAYDISDDDLNKTCLFQEDLYRYASGKKELKNLYHRDIIQCAGLRCPYYSVGCGRTNIREYEEEQK